MLMNSRTTIGSLFMLFALAACSPKNADKKADASKGGDAKEPVALTINGASISQREVDILLRQQPPQRDAPAARQRVLDNITMQTIVAQEAIKKGLDKTPDVVDELEMAKTSVLAQSYVKDYFQHVQIGDAQLTAAYEKLKADAAGKQYRARHILVATQAQAEDIIAKLKKDPKSFSELASAQSLDPVSKSKGGDLGWFDTRGMVPEFGAAVTGLEKGKFTQVPVKSQFGYHVIMLDDVRANTETVPPFEQVKAGLSDQVRQQSLQKMLDDLKAQAKIEAPALAKAP
jgi:peptidyl-prolyl cis-trans isomerase C